MKNKGFTLIELLAVIVILAIIALIAVPIILNIVGNSKKSSVVRSGELYLKAVETAIARENLNNKFSPEKCKIRKDGNLFCDGRKIIIETTGSRPIYGEIKIQDGKIKSIDGMILDNYILTTTNNKKIDIIKEATLDDLISSGSYLMINSSVNSAETTFLGGDIKRSTIESITIEKTKEVPSDAIGSWDVSEKKDGNIMAWYLDSDNNGLYELYIGGNKGVKANSNSNYLFMYFENVTTMNLNYLDVSDVDSTLYMFQRCINLIELDLSSFDTSNITNMGGMFSTCRKLRSINLNNFNTSNVTRMDAMFENCSSLTSIDVSKFDTSKVTSMVFMFEECTKLIELDLSSFNTSKVTTMKAMFSGDSNLIKIDLSKFDTSNVIITDHMFEGCKNLKTINLKNATFNNVTSYTNMFNNNIVLEIINVKGIQEKEFINDRLSEVGITGVTVTVA